MSCCSEHNVKCCEICDCTRYSSPNNSIQIDKTGCDVKLQLTPNTLQNLLDIPSSSCITVLKEIVDGKLIFTPTLKVECIEDFVVSASNGLHINPSNNVKLGGDLVEDTVIAFKDKNIFYIQNDPTDTALLLYELTGNQSGTLTKYWGVKTGILGTDITTTAITVPGLFTVKSSQQQDFERSFPTYPTGYLANSLLVIAGAEDSTKEAKLGVLVPTADSAGQTYPAEDLDKSAYVQFTEGIADIHAALTHVRQEAWIHGNTAIGGLQDTISDSRLIVTKNATYVNNPVGVTSYDALDFSTPTVNTWGQSGSTGLYASGFASLLWEIHQDQTLAPTCALAGQMGFFQFATDNNLTGGNPSASAAQGYFKGLGNLNRIIAYRALAPVEEQAGGYGGTIDEAIGVQIEAQDTVFSLGGGTITKTYGVKQLGTNDENLFNGPITFAKVLANGSLANDAAAAVAGVPVGGLYHTSGTIKIRLV